MRSMRLDRRTLLRGAAGISIGLPLLDAMLPTGAAAAGAPRRFVVFFTPNGTNAYEPGPYYHDFYPEKQGRDFSFGSEVAPLEALRKHVLFLSGINMPSDEGGDAHSLGMAHMLTGARSIKNADVTPTENNPDLYEHYAGGISIDQEIARQVGDQTLFPSLELGVQPTRDIGAHPWARMSYKAAKQPIPAVEDPRTVFDRLFSMPVAGGTGVDRTLAQRRSVLDFVADDYARLLRRVGSEDRKKLEFHLTAIRGVERRLAGTAALACKAPATWPATDLGEPGNFPEIGRQQMDLLVLALTCDLTRVASLEWSAARSDIPHPWIGVRQAHHALSHGLASAALSSINTWYADQLVSLASQMNDVSESGGTLLDNVVIFWCSDVAYGWNHTFQNVRSVLVGSCGGFFKTGQHVHFDGVNHNRLFVSFLNAMGVPATQFGERDWSDGGPLGGIS